MSTRGNRKPCHSQGDTKAYGDGGVLKNPKSSGP